jgi:hypothetical protein
MLKETNIRNSWWEKDDDNVSKGKYFIKIK